MRHIIDKIKARPWINNVIFIWGIDIIFQLSNWAANGFISHHWFDWRYNLFNMINTGFGITMLIGFSILRWWSWSRDQLNAYQHQNKHHM